MEDGLHSYDLLGDDSYFAARIEGFQPRAQQQKMAQAIENALQQQQSMVIEAGTGTGKTYAYLVPALLSKKKVIISTGTKNLQDQLYLKDLPRVQAILEQRCATALLKGRSNYLCRYRLDKYLLDGRFTHQMIPRDLRQIKTWSIATETGDIAELSQLPEDSPAWPYATSTTDNCLGQDCPQYQDCYVVKARKKALDAQIVVVNHHLFFADVALKDEGFGELLPDAEAIILDEAHQLADVATLFFGEALSSRQLLMLATDIDAICATKFKDLADVRALANQLDKQVQQLRLEFGEGTAKDDWHTLSRKEPLIQQCTDVQQSLDELEQHFELIKARDRELMALSERCSEVAELFKRLTQQQHPQHIHWYETFSKSFMVSLTPLEIDQQLSLMYQKYPCSWIFTSATLAIGDDFSHFQRQMALQQVQTLKLDSPFDYQEQGLLYVPRYWPDPRQPQFNQHVIDLVKQVAPLSQGRMFVLFTSHRALTEAATQLVDQLPFPVLVQGTQGKRVLLESFREQGNAILLATGSFWEGVDVSGDALSCVIIDKIPFTSPSEPVVRARIQALRQSGQDPFAVFQLPQSAISLKQGAGRLIRSVQDKGVLILCDPRMVSKPYAQQLLASLPDFPRTRNFALIEDFFQYSQP